MKKIIFLLSLTAFLFSCNQNGKTTVDKTTTDTVRAFGAIPDDAEALSKIPVVMSEEYKFRQITLRRATPPGKKKPPVTDTTVIVTPPPAPTPPPTSAGYQIAMPPVTSQGSEGSCVSFAIGYYIRSAEEYYKTGATSYSYASNILSPEYLFNQTKSDVNCQGSTLLAALNLMQSNGICTWQSMPYSSSNGCALFPNESQSADAANYKIISYKVVYTNDLAAIKYLLDNKHPLYISFNVDNNFYYANASFIWKSFSGSIIGQHAVTICGYDDARHAYKIVNQWGTGWGDAGYSWIDYDFMPQLSSVALTIQI